MLQFTVSEAARHISRATGQTISPQDISNLFYRRRLDDDRCPIVGRFRLIPGDYLPIVERVLRAHGFLANSTVVWHPRPSRRGGHVDRPGAADRYGTEH